MLSLWAVFAMCTSGHAAERALILALSDYDSAHTGWARLHGATDAELLSSALTKRGFSAKDIEVVTDPTKKQALAAISGWPVSEGDDLYLHYSGHGQRVTDRNGDEDDDGLDEALALVDTPASTAFAPRGYQGQRHLTDDEFGEALGRLRRRIGPTGSLVVVVDACYSGTATRTNRARGGDDFVLGTPSPVKARASTGGGLGDVLRQGPDLAPMVVLSASRSNQVAQEVRLPQGGYAGALSSALARVLHEASGLTSWRVVYGRVAAEMRMMVAGQIPQLEGAADTRLFSGEHVDPPDSAQAVAWSRDRRRLQVNAGSLLGFLVGATVSVHPWDGSASGVPLAQGTVEARDASPVNAWIVTDRAIPAADLKAGVRVRVTDVPESAIRTRVAVGLANASAERRWTDALAGLPLVEVVPSDQAPHHSIVQVGTDVYLVDGAAPPQGNAEKTSRLTGKPASELPAAWRDRIAALAQTRLLHHIHGDHKDFNVAVELQPARWNRGKRSCAPLTSPPPPGEQRFAPDDTAQLRVTLSGKPAFVSVVSTDARGVSTQLYPAPHEAWDTPNTAGEVLSLCLGVTLDPGHPASVAARNTVKVFASRNASGIDFRQFLAGPVRSVGPSREVADLARRTRSINVFDPDSGIDTDVLEFTIEPTDR